MSAGPPLPVDRPGSRPGWSVRAAVRVALVLLLGVNAGGRLVSAWVGWSEGDASTFAEADLAVAVLSIGGAWLAWWLLRPRGGPPAGTLG